MSNLGDARRSVQHCQPTRKTNPRVRYILIVIILLSGCSAPSETRVLEVIGSTPEDGQTLSADKAIHIQFDRHLSLDSVVRSGATLVSGDATANVRLSYDPVARALIATPLRNLRVGLGYRFSLPTEKIVGLDGSELKSTFNLDFRAGDISGFKRKPVSFEEDVRPIIKKTCGCHGPEPKSFPDLEMVDAMVDTPSFRQPEYALIKPGYPLQSYLVLRILSNYPGVLGEGKEVQPSDARVLVNWVSEMGAL
jgi:hypothetical protein